MKKTLIILILLAPLVYAGQYKVSTTKEDDVRIEEAFGSILNLGHPAAQSDIEAAMYKWLEGQTHDYERRKNMATFTPPPLGSTPTPTPAAKK